MSFVYHGFYALGISEILRFVRKELFKIILKHGLLSSNPSTTIFGGNMDH